MKEYAENDIKALDIREHVRSRPEIHFENLYKQKSLDDLPFEILCHALDEYFDKNCTKIMIEVSANDFTVKYDAGIPLEEDKNGVTRPEKIMTELYACRNEKKHLSVGEKYCHIGLAIINFASESSILTTVSGKQKGIFCFEKGKLISKQITTSEDDDVTNIYLKPDHDLFPGLFISAEGVKARANKLTEELAGLDILITEKK